jgi:hypothetical protein
MRYTFETKIWRYAGEAAWYFASLPSEYSDELKVLSSSNKRGFGSIRVEAEIGKTKWDTSIFPDNKSGCFMLPVKKDVRLMNNLDDGDMTKISISLKEEF